MKHKYQDSKMSIEMRIIILTITICSSSLAGAFNLPFLSLSSRKSDESSIIKDPVTDLGRLSGQKLQRQGVSNKLTDHNLIGTASDVHYVPRPQQQQEQMLAEQLALLPAAGAIYESLPVMPPGKRRLDGDSDALASNNRRIYPMLNDAATRRELKLMLKYGQPGLGNVIDSGIANIQGHNSVLVSTTRNDIDGNRQLVNLEGRLPMATTQNRKPLRVRQLNKNLRRIASNNVYQESRANRGRPMERARSATNRRQSGKLRQAKSSDDNDDGDEDDSKSDNDESTDLDDNEASSADRRSGGDDSFEREASKDFNSDAPDNTDQASNSNGEGNSQNGARYLKHSASNRGQGKQYVPVHEDQSSADDSNSQDDEDIDSTNIVSGSLYAPLHKKVVHLQVEQSTKKNYPQVNSKMNQVNDIQAAAGHHHNHHHGHYYQYVEVPKKKTWKFGFKRGNHKHESEFR